MICADCGSCERQINQFSVTLGVIGRVKPAIVKKKFKTSTQAYVPVAQDTHCSDTETSRSVYTFDLLLLRSYKFIIEILRTTTKVAVTKLLAITV